MTGHVVQDSIDTAFAKPETVRRCLQGSTLQHRPQRTLYSQLDLTVEASSHRIDPFGLPSVLDVSISDGAGFCQL